MTDKKKLRLHLKEQRRLLQTPELSIVWSRQICTYLLSLPLVQTAQHIALFSALPDEPDLSELLDQLTASQKTCYLPRIEGANDMDFFPAQSRLIQEQHYGIWEPEKTSDTLPVAPSSLDLILVPGQGFDAKGNRLGRGKGYYDKYLSRCPHVSTVGVCFGFRLVEQVPCQAWDLPVQGVVTEQGYISTTP